MLTLRRGGPGALGPRVPGPWVPGPQGPWVPGPRVPGPPGPWAPNLNAEEAPLHIYIHTLPLLSKPYVSPSRKEAILYNLIITDTNMGHAFMDHYTYNTRKPLVGKVSSPCEMLGSHRRMGPTYTMIMLTVHDGYDGMHL